MNLAATAALILAAGGAPPAGGLQEFGKPAMEVVVPPGWKSRDGAAAKREGAGPWDLYLESTDGWEVPGLAGHTAPLIVLAVVPEKEWVDSRTHAPLPLATSFERLFPLVDWGHLASREVAWKRAGPLRVHTLPGFLHEEGRLKSQTGELGTLEELVLPYRDQRVVAAGWIPPGAPKKLYQRIYRELHQTLLSLAFPCAPDPDPGPSLREAGISSSGGMEWLYAAPLGVVLPSNPMMWSNVGGWSGSGGSGLRFMGETGPASRFVDRTGFDQDPAEAFVVAEVPGDANLRDPSSTLKRTLDRFRSNPADQLW